MELVNEFILKAVAKEIGKEIKIVDKEKGYAKVRTKRIFIEIEHKGVKIYQSIKPGLCDGSITNYISAKAREAVAKYDSLCEYRYGIEHRVFLKKSIDLKSRKLVVKVLEVEGEEWLQQNVEEFIKKCESEMTFEKIYEKCTKECIEKISEKISKP